MSILARVSVRATLQVTPDVDAGFVVEVYSDCAAREWVAV